MPDPVEDDEAPAPSPPERQRLFLHIGVPKSGSTYVQGVLGGNREALKEAGTVYPFVRQEGMFHAAVEMAGSPARWGLRPDQVNGTFAHLLRRGRRIGGSVVISHEIFGAASDAQVARIGEMVAGFDLEIVVTARDLARSITADWQEHVKNGDTRSFERFSSDLLGGRGPEIASDRSFWPAQNLVGLVERWGALVPPERIHVVTAPRAGSAPDELWRRFAAAIDIDPGVADLGAVSTRNESLGIAQIALLRQVHEALDGRLGQPWRSRVAKRWFAQSVLARASSPRPVAPPDLVELLAPVSSAWVDHLAAGGHQVHGDLADLLPAVPDAPSPHPDDVSAADLLDGLPSVLAEMLLRHRDLQVDLAGLEARNDELVRELDRTHEELGAQVASLSEQVTLLTSRRYRWLPFRTPAGVRRPTPTVPGSAAAPSGDDAAAH